jgi:putative membrane-bound dehydrogenase-like protein
MRFPLSLKATVVVLSVVIVNRPAAAEEPGFKPIFDGQSLNGWSGDAGFWRVEGATIVGESTKDKPLDHNTFLVWDQGEIDDFILRLEFKLVGSDEQAANSGVQFRSATKPDGHVFGYQADIDLAGNWIGACYDELGRAMLATRGQKVVIANDGSKQATALGDAAELLKAYRRGDWNEYEISAQGGHITLKLNGQQTVDIDDQQVAERDLSGLLALQLHSGPPQRVEFKNIRLKRLKLSDGRKKAVFIAGTPSHGPRDHEYNAGCLLLAKGLNEAAAKGLPIHTAVYKNGWPKDPTALDNADTVISYCDGGGAHYLNNHLEEFDQFAGQGVGLCCLHYGVEVPKGPSGDKFLQWIGGYFEMHWSVNPHWTAHFKEFPKHPVANGLVPFEANDEWYYHMRFVEGMAGVTPILTDLPPRETLNRDDGPHSNNPAVREAVLEKKEPQHVAWVYERPGGKGRGFGYTGGHFHRNWQVDGCRKTVLNAIVWTAGLEVPASGVESTTPTDDEMGQNLDPKGQAARPKTPAKPVADSNPKASDGAKPAFSSPVVTTATAGHVVDIDADITGAKKLFLVVTDGGNGFACDWADWLEPRLVGSSGEKKLTDLDWKSAKADWGEIRKNKRVDGGDLAVAGRPVAYGIGAHAVSVIEFDLPEGYSRFKAKGGLDHGGTEQAGGQATSVQFHVFTQTPPAAFVASAAGGGGGGGGASSREAKDAVAQLDVNPDLECTLFASEPLMLNPTNIEVDHLGRIWVCEVVNYRRFANGDQPERKEGDRILVLEDSDRDGKADKSATFYQGRDIDSAHGILLMPTPTGAGTKALVSAKDQVFYLIDDNGDLKADRKEVLFTGIGGVEHDHGIHAFVFGPDGKLYFNFGNSGDQIKDKDGKPIIDKAGNEVRAHGKPYRQGMVFRCNVDGSGFETLAWNFRNNWEVAVDSFGTMWQSDNDDDGNRGVRINYVLEYGNYGYQDEITGAGWAARRTGWEEEIPKRHWHLNDPGVIPNLLQTGAGSPTGICVYEGTLLPPVFRGAPIHCDAGPNIVRAYPVKKDGAGYTAEVVNILDGAARDQWFRPTDVCVAPDGSLIISDWYDPGVGGHRMQDTQHGRLFRVAPPGTPYTAPSFDLGNPNGAAAALQSGNLAWRYLAWQALNQMGDKAEGALANLLKSGAPRNRARALWLLGKINLPLEKRTGYVKQGLNDADADVRVTAVRLVRQLLPQLDLQGLGDTISHDDPAPEVRREMLIGLRELALPGMGEVWTQLADLYPLGDRWYLEALGIAAHGRWDECLNAYAEEHNGKWNTPAGRDIVWRSRGSQTPKLLAEIISNEQTTAAELPRYFRSLDFLPEQDKGKVLESLALSDAKGDAARKSFIATESLSRVPNLDTNKPEYKEAVEHILKSTTGTSQFIELVGRFGLTDRYGEVLNLAQQNPESQIGAEAIRLILEKKQGQLIQNIVKGDDAAAALAVLKAVAVASDNRSVPLLLDLLKDNEKSLDLRREAVRALGTSRNGAKALENMAQKNEYDATLKDSVAAALHGAQWQDVKEVAAKLFPSPPSKDNKPLAPLAELINRKGEVKAGRIVFHTTGTCAQCHIVNGLGREVGPNLSEVGKKLTKQALYESILYPSAGISHNYESWVVATAEGNVLVGLITSETPEEITIRDAKGIQQTVKKSDVEARKKSEVSLMPADMQKILSEQELVDIIEYMTTLKEAKP